MVDGLGCEWEWEWETRDEEWHLEGGVLKEVDESGNTKGEAMEEAIINLLLLAALVLLLTVDGLIDVGVDVVFFLDPTPPLELALLFCHNKALNGLPAAFTPLLITPP